MKLFVDRILTAAGTSDTILGQTSAEIHNVDEKQKAFSHNEDDLCVKCDHCANELTLEFFDE